MSATIGRRLMEALANLAGLAALAAVVAYWGWHWFGPVPQPVLRVPLDDVVSALALSPPFGTTSAKDTPATAGAPVPAAGEARLLGVLAEPGGRGRALFRMPDGSARFAAPGDSLGASGTLSAVHADGVTLSTSGGERRVELRGGAPSPAGAARAGSTPRVTGCVPAGYRGPVVRLNAELVAGLIAQPQSLVAVAESKDGALVVRDDAGFAAMLGLRKGDRVVQANGIALRAPEDVIVAVLRPLAANQAVRVIGMRGAEPQELLIVNAGACP